MTTTANDLATRSTGELAVSGGDDRLLIDPETGLNVYGCSPMPRPAICFSSSTATSVSAAAYEQLRARQSQLAGQLDTIQRPAAIYGAALEDLRARLVALYGLREAVDIAFAPSGTDLELIVLALALAAPERRVVNILVGEDEVGSGCVYSAAGQHFRKATALGSPASAGTPIDGFDPDRIVLAKIEVRAADGRARSASAIFEEIVAAADAAIADGARPIIHVVHRSKTGIVVPTMAQVEALAARYAGSGDLVIDACQGRIAPDNLERYLRLGASVMMTGSKFIGGPPFSGMVFVPEPLSERMAGVRPPAGLAQYFNRAEWPQRWQAANDLLNDGCNFGLLLRLEAAVYELQRLAALPHDRVLAVVHAFGESIREFTERSQRFDLFIAAKGLRPETHIAHPFERDMLFTLHVKGSRTDGRPLDIDDAKRLYQQLYTDMSDAFSAPADRTAAAEICHVGQPVKCLKAADGTMLATLRLSLSAPLIACLAGLDDKAMLSRFAADFDRIARKTELILGIAGRSAG
jgi:hypothetical protein